MNGQFTEEDFKGKNFTLQGRIFYPALLEPKGTKLNPEKLKYSVQFAWDMGSQQAQTQEILNWLAQAKAAFLPQVPDNMLKHPVKTWGQTLKADGSPQAAHLENCHWMNISSNPDFKPALVDGSGQTVVDPALIYSGTNALVNFRFWKFAHGNNFGFSANLNAVCLQKGGDKVAGGGVNTNEAFKGFLNETAGAPTQDAFAAPAGHHHAPAGQPPMGQPLQQPMAQPAQVQQPAINPQTGLPYPQNNNLV